MGKRYRENSNGEWEEVDIEDETLTMISFFIFTFIFSVGIGVVLWAPFQILLKTPWWVSIVIPCAIALGIYLKYPSLFWPLNVCAWILMLIDICVFDWYCLSRYFEPLLTLLK